MTNMCRLIAFFLMVGPCLAQSVKLPTEVKGEPGAWIVVVPESKEGGDVKWRVSAGLTRVPIEQLFPGQKPAGVVVQASTKGRYEVVAWNAKGDVASDLAVCTVVIGSVPPVPPDPGPTPVPPTPVPPTPNPAPIPVDGFRTLIIYESAELGKMPATQNSILYTKEVRDYLNSKTVKGADGKTGEWRIWDKDVDTSNESKLWQDAMKRARTLTVKDVAVDKYEVWSPTGLVATFQRREEAVALATKTVPWLIVSTGKDGWEGPLPLTVTETLAILKKYGG